MCLLCSSSSDAVFCPDHEKAWNASAEYRRYVAFQQAKDERLPALHRSAFSDFIRRTLLERQNGTPDPKP